MFDLKHHVVWITKYRYKVSRGDVAEAGAGVDTADLCGAGGDDYPVGGLAGSHPHAGGGAPAVGAGEAGAVHQRTVVPDAAAGVRGVAQGVLGPTSVGAGYFCASVGAVDEEARREYIETQRWDEDVDGFKITAPTEP